ncbi:hypothetical protein [Streptomyces tsukubensis]|uniref:Uncharacterized protein n=1 Tax=Streptomyces tsukubensis TaxID=83656 RepID=A0A1V4A1F6_9ACTN|nr:hypothetical protein [Streptomyces tsukubensis]OON72227.1 hypothetical protein B1H18_30390 [Streptomyces tsukubensis]
MVRNVIGAVLAVLGGAAAMGSPFREWYDKRLGREYQLSQLFEPHGVTGAHATLMWSLFLPFLVAAVLILFGILARSRLLVATAGVIVLGFTVLWMVRVAQANGGSLTLNSDGSGLGQGVAGAAGGGVLLLLAAAVMSGRHQGRRRRRAHGGPGDDDTYADYREPHAPEPTPGASPYGPGQNTGSGYGASGHGTTGYGSAGYGSTGHDPAGHGSTGHGSAGHDEPERDPSRDRDWPQEPPQSGNTQRMGTVRGDEPYQPPPRRDSSDGW